jgi:hypothetical protein
MWNTKRFDLTKEDTRDTGVELKQLGGTLHGTTFPHFNDRAMACYGEYPATVSSKYIPYGITSLASLTTA